MESAAASTREEYGVRVPDSARGEKSSGGSNDSDRLKCRLVAAPLWMAVVNGGSLFVGSLWTRRS